MTDIGNGDPQPETGSLGFTVNRIIEVPSILTIDSDQPQFSKINTVFLIRFRGLIA